MIGTTVKLGFDGSAVERGMAGLKGKFSGLAKSLKADFSRLTIFGGIGAGVGVGIAKSMLDITASFEKALTMLKGTEGSAEKAEKAFDWIKKFAKETPFEVNQVLEAFVKLKNYGIDPIADDSLRILGDTASGTTKDLIQAVEAVSDATMEQGMRLKEAFSIDQNIEGNKISYTFTDKFMKEQVVTVERGNKKIIASTLLAILNDKYKGAMMEQSKTWNGMVSNMKDAWAGFAYKVMMSGPFLKLKEQLAGFLKEIDKMDADGRLQAWANDVGTKMVKAGETIWSLAKGISGAIISVKDLVGGWENLAYVMIAANFAPTIAAIVQMTTSLKLMSVATWAAAGPWVALAAAITAVYDVMNKNNLGEFVANLFPEDAVLKFGELLNDLLEGFGSIEGFKDRFNQMQNDFGKFSIQPGAAPQSSTGTDATKQLEEQIRILKDIRAQGTYTVLA